MSQHDEPGKSRRILRSLFGVSFRVRPVGEIKEQLRRLEKWEPSAELEEKKRRMQRVKVGLARTALLDELKRAEYLEKKPWLRHAPIVFWSVSILVALLAWLLTRR
jgi:hypothetical protein